MHTFTQENTMFYHNSTNNITDKIAAFDIDWTITYSSIYLFSSEPTRKDKLQQLIDYGYTLTFSPINHVDQKRR
jgi:hypothetical protein